MRLTGNNPATAQVIVNQLSIQVECEKPTHCLTHGRIYSLTLEIIGTKLCSNQLSFGYPILFMPTYAFTIRKLADAAGVGVEAVRYYQGRNLLHEPQRVAGGFREYSIKDVQRIRFIKRAQELGFSLDEIAELLSLSAERDQVRVRELTKRRAAEIHERIRRLEAMASALEGLVSCCAQTPRSQSCPIILALAADPVAEIPVSEPPPSHQTVPGTKRYRHSPTRCNVEHDPAP